MEHRVLDFVHALRSAEIPVTLTEAMDAIRALEHLPIWDREVVRDGLRTALVKREVHHREFDRLFGLFFSHLEEPPWGGPREQGDASDSQIIAPQMEQIEEMVSGLSGVGAAIAGGQGMVLERMAMEAAQSTGVANIQFPLQVGSYTRRLMEQFDWARLDEELREIVLALQRRGLPAPDIARLTQLLEQNRGAFRSLLRRLVERELEKNLRPVRERLMVDGLTGKSFASLSDQEIEQMRDVVARLVQRLRTKIALLERRRRRGRFDIRRTLRRNLQYGGTPMELAFKEKKRKKAQVMALCDVSSSVWNASRFMLNLLYAIQDQFARVRSFVFVSDLGEVTEFFSRYETNEAIRKALKEAGIRYHSYTDYGDVFLRFHEEYLGDVNSRTVIIIIGDGRNNLLPHQSWVLEAMKERAKKVIWLNPEPRSMWGFGDSAMHEYVPHCTMVEECRNLRQLAAFVDGLVM